MNMNTNMNANSTWQSHLTWEFLAKLLLILLCLCALF